MWPRAAAALAALVSLTACTTPHRPARLPEGPYVAVLSGEMPPPIDRVARHGWIVAQPAAGPMRRFELQSSGGPDPFDNFAAGDVMLHGVIRGTPEEIDALIDCLARAEREYHAKYPQYLPIPGPNSNTYVAFLGRACSLGVELPATAIGRDYVGPAGAAVTESGTGFILGTWPLGLRMGLREGVVVIVLGLPIGVHFAPPGLELPINPGRLGLSTDAHITREPNRGPEPPFPDDPAKTAAASVILYASGFVVTRPERARGLEGQGALGIGARAVLGRTVGYAAGLDLEMGLAVPAALSGRACLYPLGVGVLLSQTGFLAVLGGIGASGTTDQAPSGLELPLEVRLEIDLAAEARVAVFAREAFTVLERSRDNGALGLGELTVGARARFGSGSGFGFGARGGAGASGWFFGVERREIARTAQIGVVVGTEIDGGL
ncbi:MAG: DUF3750 domain-containing protein [Polyangiaceae bacterium]|nr:DUF3750 domain-containing protein [Polyangiaceae bacterium]